MSSFSYFSQFRSHSFPGPKMPLNLSSVSPRIYISRLSFLCSIPVYKETSKYAARLTPTSGRAIGCFQPNVSWLLSHNVPISPAGASCWRSPCRMSDSPGVSPGSSWQPQAGEGHNDPTEKERKRNGFLTSAFSVAEISLRAHDSTAGLFLSFRDLIHAPGKKEDL